MVAPKNHSKKYVESRSRRRFVRGLLVGATVSCVTSNLLADCSVMPEQKRSSSRSDKHEVMDQALEILAKKGPEYSGGLSNHGPMAAEALIRLGRPGNVIPWIENYKRRLQDPPEARNPISKKEWREGLGNVNRVGDWIAFFNREMKEASWRSVLKRWIPLLAPGMVAAANHSIIRTGHAVRSIEDRETELRRQELAQGLGYWAARYQSLPASTKRKNMGLRPSQAIQQVKVLPVERRGGEFIHGKLRRLDDFPPFATVADMVNTTGDASRFISDLTETFAAVYLANAPDFWSGFAFIHAVTGPSAVRLLLPYVNSDAKRDLLRYAWQASAGLYAAFGKTPVPGAIDRQTQDKEDLIDRAVKALTKEEHAVKFTEVCLREYALSPNPIYLLAARHASDSALRI